jgi:ferredoxin
MENNIINSAENLLKKSEIDLFIGYEKGTHHPRPVFIYKTEDVYRLIFDKNCSGNLAVYLTRKDLSGGKKIGISASYYTLKSIVQLFDENQLKEENLRVLVLSETGELKTFQAMEEIKQYLKETPSPSKQNEDELVKKIENMRVEDRWSFWSNELSRCFKCYACRAACPMCYCTKCIVEINRPQWIQPWSSPLGNMEWQINRVMHLAGRCSDCGACGAACPLGIPVHLLTHKMAKSIQENFGSSDNKGNVLSTFKPEDKENFIR